MLQQQDKTCQRNNACQTMHYQVVHLDFDELPNELASELGQIETALTLDETLIDTLITAGEYLLIHNDKLQAAGMVNDHTSDFFGIMPSKR